MHVLVTGASGFVGPHLIRALLKKYSVTAFIRRKSDSSVNPILLELQQLYPGQLEITRGDITSFKDIKDAVCAHSNLGLIFHLASQSFVPDSVKNPEYTHQVNTLGTLNLLEAVRYTYPPPRIVFASSSEVYGWQLEDELPINENSTVRPLSPYASAKLYGENLCRNYYHNYKIPTVISRAFNHEGPGRGHHFVTSSIIRQMVMVKKKEKDTVYVGNVETSRDWSHVSDIVNAYILLGEKGIPGETYVSGSGIERTIADFIRRVQLLLSLDNVTLVEFPSLTRNVDVPRLRANPTKIKELGWKPSLGLDDIITQMIAYYMGMSRKQRETLEYPREKGTEFTLSTAVNISGQVVKCDPIWNMDAQK